VSVALVHPDLVRARVQRPMIVEPFNDRYRAVGLDQGESDFPGDRQPVTIITDTDEAAIVETMVHSITGEKGI
jgi:hypothetical protein